MTCVDLDKRLADTPGEPLSDRELLHASQCKRCMEKHGLSHALHVLSSHDLSSDEEALPTGELEFLNTLQLLGEAQSDAYNRAQFLHNTVQKGDRFYWRGEYVRAARYYREALMVVKDDQGRVALQNKLARVQVHRQHFNEAVLLLMQALRELGEPTPSGSPTPTHVWRENMALWATELRHLLARIWPHLFPLTTKYGDRSRAAQHLYRELATLAQHNKPTLSRWANQRELQWAIKLQQPLEQVVSWGRRAVRCAERQQAWRAHYWLNKVSTALSDTTSDPVLQASADFYIGRASFILGRWDQARFHLERCVDLSQSARDAYLRDAALQHLIRVYRNDGNFAQAVHVAGQLLGLYHKLGNLPRLSACCRHFSLIYAAYGDLRRARSWAHKALSVAEEDSSATQEQSLSRMRCYVLLADLDLRSGRKDTARLYLGEAIRIQRSEQLPLIYLRDGLALLRKILGQQSPRLSLPWFARLSRWLASKWAIMRGDLERAHHLQQQRPSFVEADHQIPSELAYLYQEYSGEARPGGLREAIPASAFARDFLSGEVPVRPEQPSFSREADQLASMFPVGAVSSRWGRGALAHDRSGAITAQLSNGSDAPWGYFFADDIS